MQIVADMHTHTVASGHAYSTVNELARAAADRGLSAMAITDHGPGLPGGPHLYHFGALRFIPTYLYGVRILTGVEANITDREGTLDLPDQYLERLNFVLAGLHEGCGCDGKGTDFNTAAVVAAMENPYVNAISHPGNPAFPLHYEEIVRKAALTGTAIEINNASFTISRKGSRANCEHLATLIARHQAPVVVGSDAHIAQGVGEFADALALLTAAGIREEQVINSSLQRLCSFLGLKDEASVPLAPPTC